MKKLVYRTATTTVADLVARVHGAFTFVDADVLARPGNHPPLCTSMCCNEKWPLQTSAILNWMDCFLLCCVAIIPAALTRPPNYYWIPLFLDAFLLLMFAVQHHFQASVSLQKFFGNYQPFVAERLLYNAATCLSLQVLMRCWQPVTISKLWNYSTSENDLLWWVFTVVHMLAWFFIYAGCLVMDMAELVGIKQVYYSLQGWQNPLWNKSENLRRLYSHMRHPSFSAITVILFIHPVMSVDRFLIAVVFTSFMVLCFRVDENDYLYQKKQLRQKETSLQSTFLR